MLFTMPFIPSWFRVAVEALVVIATTDGRCPSREIAHAMQAHPAFLRRICGLLVQAAIVKVREGRDGGYQLARPPEAITLDVVYQAIIVAPPDLAEPVDNLDDRLQRMLDDISRAAEQHLIQILQRTTLADILQGLHS